jgi:hypothetical protein
MTHQEYVALGLATVCLVTNFLGAAFTIKRVYAKWTERASPSSGRPAYSPPSDSAAARRAD